MFVLAWLVVALARSAGAATLAERLGYRPTDRLLIINGDDAGMCHSANEATVEALEHGLLTSSTIMVPCPWFGEIADYAKRHPQRDFDVHLCHTSEWKHYRWRSVAPPTSVPGLIDPDGFLWHEVPDVCAHANPAEALTEARAQIQRALAAGVDVTHLDSHMGTLQLDPRYLAVYLQLAVEFALPVRMASQATMESTGHSEVRAAFAAKGIAFSDFFIYEELKDERDGVKKFWINILRKLKPGVTELYIHAAKPTEELKAITGSWASRAAEFETFTHDPELRQLVAGQKIILIGYRPLRDLQRKGRQELR